LVTQRAIFSIAAFAGTAVALRAALNVDLPAEPKRVEVGGVTYLWSGAGSWLAVAETFASLEAPCAAAQKFAAITDQSDGKVIFAAGGPGIRGGLATLIPIDLHESVFAPDATALTLAGHIPIQIWRTGAENFELACFRSYAASLYHALVEAI
jgi:heterotetrameric sarcosine oxidase gamma subunit